jgi:hypothetical protein
MEKGSTSPMQTLLHPLLKYFVLSRTLVSEKFTTSKPHEEASAPFHTMFAGDIQYLPLASVGPVFGLSRTLVVSEEAFAPFHVMYARPIIWFGCNSGI